MELATGAGEEEEEEDVCTSLICGGKIFKEGRLVFCGKKRKMGSLQSEVVVMGSLQQHVKIANGLHMLEHDLLPVRLTRNNFRSLISLDRA